MELCYLLSYLIVSHFFMKMEFGTVSHALIEVTFHPSTLVHTYRSTTLCCATDKLSTRTSYDHHTSTSEFIRFEFANTKMNQTHLDSHSRFLNEHYIEKKRWAKFQTNKPFVPLSRHIPYRISERILSLFRSERQMKKYFSFLCGYTEFREWITSRNRV